VPIGIHEALGGKVAAGREKPIRNIEGSFDIGK
jgi:hypothetical protein